MKLTNLMPFSNGTDAMTWQSNNCANCDQYENESTKREKAKCKYAFDLEFAQGSGGIPISTLNFFGFDKFSNLCNCPILHLDKTHTFEDVLKKQKEAEEKRKAEPELDLPF